MALMDAGIPLHEHVAGVSVGLVSEIDPSTGTIKDYRILTDILVRFLLGSFVLSSALWLSVQNSSLPRLSSYMLISFSHKLFFN